MRLILTRTLVALAVTLSLGVMVTPLSAQQTAIDGANATELEALAATLEDDAKRAAFLDQLRALIAAQHAAAPSSPQPGGGAQFLDQISQRVDNVSSQLVTAAATLLDIPTQVRWIRGALGQSDARATLATAAGGIILVLLAGMLAQWIVLSLLTGPRSAVEARVEDRLWLRLTLLVVRTLLDLVPVLAFAGAAYGALALLDPERVTRLIAVAVINASLLSRAVLVVARLVLAPRVGTLRILSIEDETANYAFIWVRRFTYLSIYGFFAIDAALLLGLPAASHAVLIKLLGLAIGLLLIMIIVQNREQVSARIRGDGTGSIGNLRRRIADIWHILLILYLITIYLVWVFEVAGGFRFALRATLITLVIVIAARLIAAAVNHGIRRGFALSHEVKARLPGLEARANRYLPWVHTGVRSLVYLLAFFAILQAWGLGIYSWLAEPAGRALLSKIFSIVLIVTSALVVWELVSAAIERYLHTDQDGSEVEPSDRGLRTAVCEVTDLIDLEGWPERTRVIIRRQPKHPGTQTTLLPDLEYRFWGHYTDQAGDPVELDRQIRAHAHVEDHIQRLKDSGLERFPFTTWDANQAWLQTVMWAADLASWFQLLCLTGPLAKAKPRRLRWTFWHTPARIIRTARRDVVRILDGWPTADAIVAAYRAIAALT